MEKVMGMRNGGRRGAFTLIEVVVAMAIFFLLAGGIFAAIQAATRASTELGEAQLERMRSAAFRRFCRTVFASLPGDAQVELRIRKLAGKGDVVEVLLWPAPRITEMLAGTAHWDGMALSGVPDGSGRFRISVATFDSTLTASERDKVLDNATWIGLLPDVDRMTWRFAPPGAPESLEQWPAANGRPGLAELYLERLGAKEEMRFWIPLVEPYTEPQPPEAGPQATPTPTPTPPAQ